MTGGRYAMDGCATFFRRERFTIVKKYEVEFNKAAQSYVEVISDQDDRRRNEHRLMKPNVALILVLEGTQSSARLQSQTDATPRTLVCVANTHIHANQDLPDVKLWQVRCHMIQWMMSFAIFNCNCMLQVRCCAPVLHLDTWSSSRKASLLNTSLSQTKFRHSYNRGTDLC
jgi:hypothetical protein